MSIRGNAKTGFAIPANIGPCRTDRTDTGKDGVTMKDIVAGRKRLDYFANGSSRQYTESFFDKFMLPMPKENIYRGNSQDLLFFDDLGFVVRTGPMNIIDMIHPCVLQPLYWMPLDSIDHVIAIYPGIHLPEIIFNTQRSGDFETDRRALVEFMQATNQLTKDTVSPHNFGYTNEQLVILDTEDHACGTKWRANKEHKNQIYKSYEEEGASPHVAIRQVMVELYGDRPEFNEKIKAYDYHQPLRAQIDAALSEPVVGSRYVKLYDFYQTCRDSVAGLNPEVALYAPWTGKVEDNEPKVHAPAPRPSGLA